MLLNNKNKLYDCDKNENQKLRTRIKLSVKNVPCKYSRSLMPKVTAFQRVGCQFKPSYTNIC